MKNFQVYGIIAIAFLADNESGILTRRYELQGELPATDESSARTEAEQQARTFIDANYPVRWSSEIEMLNVVAD